MIGFIGILAYGIWSYDGNSLQLLPTEEVELKKLVDHYCGYQDYVVFEENSQFGATFYGCDDSLFTGWNSMRYWPGLSTFGKIEIAQYYVCRATKIPETDKLLEIVVSTTRPGNLTLIESIDLNITIKHGSYDLPKNKAGIVVPLAFGMYLYRLNCEPNQTHPKQTITCSPTQRLNASMYKKYNSVNETNVPGVSNIS